MAVLEFVFMRWRDDSQGALRNRSDEVSAVVLGQPELPVGFQDGLLGRVF